MKSWNSGIPDTFVNNVKVDKRLKKDTMTVRLRSWICRFKRPFWKGPSTFSACNVRRRRRTTITNNNKTKKRQSSTVITAKSSWKTLQINIGWFWVRNCFARRVISTGSQFSLRCPSSASKGWLAERKGKACGNIPLDRLLSTPKSYEAVAIGGGNSNIFGMFTPIPGEMIQFDEHIFPRGWNHQLGWESCWNSKGWDV